VAHGSPAPSIEVIMVDFSGRTKIAAAAAPQ
jgi:hypothetical protein